MENKVIHLVKEKKEGKVIVFPGVEKTSKTIAKPKLKLQREKKYSEVNIPKGMINKKTVVSIAMLGAVFFGGVIFSNALSRDKYASPEQYINIIGEDNTTSYMQEATPTTFSAEEVTDYVTNFNSERAEEFAAVVASLQDNVAVESANSVLENGLAISSSAFINGTYGEYTIHFTASVDGSKVKEKDGVLDFDKKHINVNITSIEDMFTDEERVAFAEDKSLIEELAKEQAKLMTSAKKDLESSAGREKLKADLLESIQ